MRVPVYGKKMFVADLILTSIWALFCGRYCSLGLLLIPIRLALCFEMERKSPWTIVSAVGFLIAYVCAGSFSKPFERMFYIFLCAIGQSELMIDTFSRPLEWEMEVWIGSLSTIWFLWLAILPIVVGIRFHNFKGIQWKRKWVWVYLLPLIALSVWAMFEEGAVGGFLLGLAVCLLPIVYWCIYDRHGRSPIQLILNDKKVLWYVAYATFMLAAIAIGLRDIYLFKLIGLLVFPPLTYILLTLSLRLGKVLTRCCVALSVAGLLYWLTLDNGKTVSIVMLIVAVALIMYVGITMMLRNKRWTAALILVLIVPTAIIPFTLGFNPYIILDAEHSRMYCSNLSVRQGVYVVEKYAEQAEKGTPHYWCHKRGLRDRYGLILPMEYDELKVIDGRGRYIVTKMHLRDERHQRHGVFDLRNRKFVVDPNNIVVSSMEEMFDHDNVEYFFGLINPDGRTFLKLCLPGFYKGVYYPDAHVEPYFANGETSIAELMKLAVYANLDIDDELWKLMRRVNPHAYKLLAQIDMLSCLEDTPVNDLNSARALRIMIENNPYYKGDVEKALSEAERLIITITDSGSQSDLNLWSVYSRLISSIRTSLAYDSLMASFPHNERLNSEYVAWHNLIEAMIYYQDFLYSARYDRSVQEEKNNTIIKWLDYRRNCIEMEQDILSGKLTYAVSPSKTGSIIRDADIEELFRKYHSDYKPSYHPMWGEIKPAFDSWRSERDKIAENLDPQQALSYREYTREVADGIFSYIEALDNSFVRPAL